MGGLSSSGETAVLASILTTAYVSLHTADPGNTGASEVTGDPAYTRQSATFANAGSNPTVASNSAILTWTVATASWGTIGFFGLWTAATAGSFLGSGAVATPKPIGVGDQPRFLANALTVTAN